VVMFGKRPESPTNECALQWVHGRITVVMVNARKWPGPLYVALQWVHGRITVVMRGGFNVLCQLCRASMGPRSDNRGYAPKSPAATPPPAASMGPRSDNRGYGRRHRRHAAHQDGASMGPRSDNRGYGACPRLSFSGCCSFNGSTVG